MESKSFEKTRKNVSLVQQDSFWGIECFVTNGEVVNPLFFLQSNLAKKKRILGFGGVAFLLRRPFTFHR